MPGTACRFFGELTCPPRVSDVHRWDHAGRHPGGKGAARYVGAVLSQPFMKQVAVGVDDASCGQGGPGCAAKVAVACSARVKRTPLYERHIAAGAKIVPFAGWEMPVQYTGIIAEHEAVRGRAGLFDVSHMGQLELTGDGSAGALDAILSRPAARLAVGEAQYALLLNEAGGTVDDVMVYRLEEARFLLIVNAANVEKDWLHVQAHLPASAQPAASNRSAEYGLLALQGPKAEQILQWLCQRDLSQLPRNRVAPWPIADGAAWVARTGYTGEDGFEVLVAMDRLGQVWDALREVGPAQGMAPAGLGARDTLRLEASMPLYGNELDEETSPLQAGLGWTVAEGGGYVGSSAVARLRAGGLDRRLRMLQLAGRAVARAGSDVQAGGQTVGKVTSGSFSPTLQRPIAMAYVNVGVGAPGSQLDVIVRGRAQPATVVKRPFYKRELRQMGNGGTLRA